MSIQSNQLIFQCETNSLWYGKSLEQTSITAVSSFFLTHKIFLHATVIFANILSHNQLASDWDCYITYSCINLCEIFMQVFISNIYLRPCSFCDRCILPLLTDGHQATGYWPIRGWQQVHRSCWCELIGIIFFFVRVSTGSIVWNVCLWLLFLKSKHYNIQV